MKIMVVGGAGYIGSHAVYKLLEKNYNVIILDNLSTGFESNLHPKAKFYNVDITNVEDIKKVFQSEKDINAIMNFAGLISVAESNEKPLEYFNVNTCGVYNLLSIAKDYNIKSFIFSSTAAVYGEANKIPINENDPKEPINPYGSSKLASENLIKDWAKKYNNNYVIFRYFNVAGAHENQLIGIKSPKLTHLIPIIINNIINKNGVFTIFGNDYETSDGTCIRDFIHVNDLVEAHILGLEWSIKNHKSEVFNLGSGIGYSVKEILDTAQKILGVDINYKIEKRRKGDPAKLLSNNKKAQTILKWSPKYTLEQIIKSEYDFRKNNIK